MKRSKKCISCKKLFDRGNRASDKQWSGRKFCSNKCFADHYITGKRGKDHFGWKNGGKGYGGVHNWLVYFYGKADKCEMKNCPGKSKKFDWAKKTGKTYIRRRNNFWRLCRSCHSKYDGKYFKIPHYFKGKKLSPERIKQLKDAWIKRKLKGKGIAWNKGLKVDRTKYPNMGNFKK